MTTAAQQAQWERDIAAGNECADQIFEDMVDEVPDQIWCETVFGLWITLTHALVEMGWTYDDLRGEVATHATLQDAGGRIQ